MSEIRIQFNDYISIKDTALVGRDYAKKMHTDVLAKIGSLSELENKYDTIYIVIPKRIVTMNKSFFLGFFEERIMAIGKEKFLNKYIFDASEYIVNKISPYAESALLSASMKDILDA